MPSRGSQEKSSQASSRKNKKALKKDENQPNFKPETGQKWAKISPKYTEHKKKRENKSEISEMNSLFYCPKI